MKDEIEFVPFVSDVYDTNFSEVLREEIKLKQKEKIRYPQTPLEKFLKQAWKNKDKMNYDYEDEGYVSPEIKKLRNFFDMKFVNMVIERTEKEELYVLNELLNMLQLPYMLIEESECRYNEDEDCVVWWWIVKKKSEIIYIKTSYVYK